MNALQMNFVVHDFAAAIRFYSAMFARPPAMLKSDCAEWVLSESSARFMIVAAGVSRCETAPRARLVAAPRAGQAGISAPLEASY